MKNHTKNPPTMGNQKNPPLFLAFMLCVVAILVLALAVKPVPLSDFAACVADHSLDACAKAVRGAQS